MIRTKSLQFPFQKRLRTIIGLPIKVNHILNRSHSLKVMFKQENQPKEKFQLKQFKSKSPIKPQKLEKQKPMHEGFEKSKITQFENQKLKKIQYLRLKKPLQPIRLKTQSFKQVRHDSELKKQYFQSIQKFKRLCLKQENSKSLQNNSKSRSLKKNNQIILKPLKKQTSLKEIQKNKKLRNNILKIEFPQHKRSLKLNRQPLSFVQIIPNVGYQHFELPFQMKDAIHCTISKNGVMITYDQNQTFFYKIKQFQNYLQKIQKLRSIHFFNKFFIIKCLRRWKIFSLRKKFVIVQSFIRQKISTIYRKQFFQLQKIYRVIYTYKYIKSGDSSPLDLAKYANYLHINSYHMVKGITTEHFPKIIQICLTLIRKKLQNFSEDKLQKFKEYHLFKIKKTKAAKKMQLMQAINTVQHKKHKTFQFHNELNDIQPFIKKVFYNFAHCYLQWTRNITLEVINKLESLFNKYCLVKDKTKEKLKNLFNIDYKEDSSQKPIIYDSQMRQILYICNFEERSKQEKVIQFKICQEDIITMFSEFVEHIIQKLQQKQILKSFQNIIAFNYKQGKTQQLYSKTQIFQYQILRKIIQSVDVYNSQNLFRQQKIWKVFLQNLTDLVKKNMQQARQIIALLNGIIADVFDYYKMQNNDTSYILSYTILQDTKTKISLIPDELMIGLLVFDIRQIKKYSTNVIQQTIQSLIKDLPTEFMNCFQNFYDTLMNYSNNINSTAWTIKEFLISYRYKQMFQQYREQQIYKDQQKLKNILAAISKTIPKTYEECYLMSLRIKDMIQKIGTKIHSFELNCIKKLKYLKSDIQQFSNKINSSMIFLKNQISKLEDCESENFLQKAIEKIPSYQESLKNLKIDIEDLNYMQTLQIRFGLKEELTSDINLFQKCESDVKLIKSILKNYLGFKKLLQQQMETQITAFNSQNILQQISTYKSQLKTSEKYLISFFQLLRKINKGYQNQKQFIQTANQLSTMAQDDVQEILKKLNHNVKRNEKLTLAKLKSFQIQQDKQQIFYQIQKKEKRKKMQLVLSQVQNSINQLCLLAQLISTSENLISRTTIIETNQSSNKGNNKLSLNKQSSYKSTNLQINYFSGFINIIQTIKIIKQIENQLNHLAISPFLQDQKKQLFVKLQYINNIIKFMQKLSQSQTKVFKLIQDGIFQKSQNSTFKSLQQNPFQKYKQFKFDPKIQKDIVSSWQYILRKFHGKKINQIAFYYLEYSKQIQSFFSSIEIAQKIVNVKINQKKVIFNFLYFFNNSTVLKFISNPKNFINKIYPVQKCQKIDDKAYTMHSFYGQKIQIQLVSEPTMFIKSFYQKTVEEIKNLFQQNLQKTPIDNINYFIGCSIPLQIVYVLDQITLQQKSIAQAQKQNFIHILVGQTKMISKLLQNRQTNNQKHYKFLLIQLLISSRIEYRHRIQNFPIDNLWNQVLIYQIDSNKRVSLRNLNNSIHINYIFSDSHNLLYSYPGCQKTLFKICEGFSGQFPCIYVQQSQSLKAICSRTMNLMIELDYQKSLAQDLSKGVIFNKNVVTLIKFCQQIQIEQISKILRFIQKAKRQISVKKLQQFQKFDSNKIPMISNSLGYFQSSSVFVNSTKSFRQIPKQIKIFFQQYNYCHPNYQLIIMTRFQAAGISISSLSFQIIHYIRGYFKIYEQNLKKPPNYKFISNFMDQIISKLSFKKEIDYPQIIFTFLIPYYSNFGCDENLLIKAMKVSVMEKTNKVIKTNGISGKMFCMYYQNQNKNKIAVEPKTKILQLRQNLISFIDSVSMIKFYPQLYWRKVQKIAQNMIINKNTQMICLFGDYASGKTTIINLLKDFLLKYKMIESFQSFHQKDFFSQDQGLLRVKTFLKPSNYYKDKLLTLQIASEQKCSKVDVIIQLFNQTLELKHTQNKFSSFRKLIIELRSLRCLSPNIFLNVTKIYIPDEFCSTQFYFELWSKQILLQFNVFQKHDQHLKFISILQASYNYLVNAYNLIQNENNSIIEWTIISKFSNILGTTLRLFNCFVSPQKIKLENLFNLQKQNLVLKILFYCLFWSLIYSVEQSSYQIVQKILKQYYYKINEGKQIENFLYKILKVENSQCNFSFLKVLNQQKVYVSLNNRSLIIQNLHMKCFCFFTNKLMNQRYKILFFGKQQCGKSTYIENYFNKFEENLYIRLRSSKRINVIQILRKIFAQRNYKKNRCFKNNIENCQKLNNANNSDLIIWIQGIQLYHNTNQVQKYLKYVSDYKQYFFKRQNKKIDNLQYIVQRKHLPKNYLIQNWNLSLMSITPTEQNLEGIFTQYLQNILGQYIIFNSTQQDLKTQTCFITNQNFTLIKFYLDEYKQNYENWTYYMSYQKYKHFLEEFFLNKKLNYFSTMTVSQIIFKLNFNLFFTLYCSLKTKKKQQTFISRIRTLLQIDQNLRLNSISFNSQLSQKQNLMSVQSQEEKQMRYEKLATKIKENKYLKNNLVNSIFCQNFQTLKYALLIKKHLMVNKAIISNEYSFLQMSLQAIGYNYVKIISMKSQEKFNQQMNKICLANTNLAKMYVYICYQTLKLNPSCLEWIVKYIQGIDLQSKQDHKNSSKKCQNPIFLIQYSDYQLELVGSFLSHKILNYFTVIRYTGSHYLDFSQIGLSVLLQKYKNQDQQVIKQFNQILNRYFLQISSFNAKQFSSYLQKFMKQYIFNQKNYLVFISYCFQIYLRRNNIADLKKNSLQFTLSQLNGILKQYKDLVFQESSKSIIKKQILKSVQMNKIQLSNCQKKLNKMQVQSKQTGVEKLKELIQQKRINIQLVKSEQIKMSKKVYFITQSLSRSEIAELKYIFVNNFQSKKEIFQCICILLGENLQISNMKKVLMDVSLTNKLAQIKIQEVSYAKILQISNKIQIINFQKQQRKQAPIIQWFKILCHYRKIKEQNKTYIPKIQKQILQLQQKWASLKVKSQIQYIQFRIKQLKTQISDQVKQIEGLSIRLRVINKLIFQLHQFQQLEPFRDKCQQFKQSIEASSKQFIYYSILEASEVTFFNLFPQSIKKKIKANMINVLRRRFNFISNPVHLSLFLSFQKQQTKDYQQIIKIKRTAPYQIDKLIRYLNKVLTKNQQIIVMIDPNDSFKSLVNTSQVLIVDLQYLMNKNFQFLNQKCLIIDIQDCNWEINVKQISKNTKIQKKIIQHNGTTIVIPGQIKIIFRKKEIKTYTETMNKFRILRFQVTQENYYYMIKMIIMQELVISKQHTSLFNLMSKQDIADEHFTSAVLHFCQNSNKIELSNSQTLNVALSYIHQWKKALAQTKGFQFQAFQQKNQNQKIKKIYRNLSKAFKIVQNYFSSSKLNSQYFLSALQTGSIYCIYNFGDQRSFILYYVLSMVIYSLRDIKTFFAIFYLKVLSVEENSCTMIESQNLLYPFSQLNQLQANISNNLDNQSFNYFKYLPYQNKQLQSFVRKLLAKKNQLNQQQILELIESQQKFTYFQKLLFKRILTPAQFDNEMQIKIKESQHLIQLNNLNFIQKFFQRGFLFCECDIYFWRKNMKLKFNYYQIELSQLDLQNMNYNFSQKPYLILDDFQIQDMVDRNKIIEQLKKYDHMSTILFSHLQTESKILEGIKIIPFLLFLEIYCHVDPQVARAIKNNKNKSELLSFESKKEQKQLKVIKQSETQLIKKKNIKKGYVENHCSNIMNRKQFDQKSIILTRFSNVTSQIIKSNKNQNTLIGYYYWKIYIWYESEDKLQFFNFKQSFVKNQLSLLQKKYIDVHAQQIFQLFAKSSFRQTNQVIGQKVYKLFFRNISKFLNKIKRVNQQTSLQQVVYSSQMNNRIVQINNLLDYSRDIATFLSNNGRIDSQNIQDFMLKRKLFSIKKLNRCIFELAQYYKKLINKNKNIFDLQLFHDPLHLIVLFSKPAYKIYVIKKQNQNFNQNQIQKSQKSISLSKKQINSLKNDQSSKKSLQRANTLNDQEKIKNKMIKEGELMQNESNQNFENEFKKKTSRVRNNDKNTSIKNISSQKTIILKNTSSQKMISIERQNNTKLISFLGQQICKSEQSQSKKYIYNKNEKIKNNNSQNYVFLYNNIPILLKPISKKQKQRMSLTQFCAIKLFSSFWLKTFFIKKNHYQIQITLSQQSKQIHHAQGANSYGSSTKNNNQICQKNNFKSLI